MFGALELTHDEMEDGSDLEFEDHGDVKDDQEEEEDVVS